MNKEITGETVRQVKTVSSMHQRKAEMASHSDAFTTLPGGYGTLEELLEVITWAQLGIHNKLVHITQGNMDGSAVIVSWVTLDEPWSNTVLYGTSEDNFEFHDKGKLTRYTYYNYTSGFIHHCTLKNLKFSTKYYYKVGIGNTTRQLWFTTPPEVGPDVPYTFGLIGNLGQSYDSNSTLSHYESNPIQGQAVLFVGDLSYADNYPNHDNVRWDTREGLQRKALHISHGSMERSVDVTRFQNYREL